MIKALIVSDGSNFSEGAFEFVRQLNSYEPILLIGAFVPRINFDTLLIQASTMFPVMPYDKETNDKMQKCVYKFRQLCEENNINYEVHIGNGESPLFKFRVESRYADLLIVGGEMFYEKFGSGKYSKYLQDILHESECPVIVVPEVYTFPSKNIIAFDGSSSSAYALKQFAYLLPHLAKNETILANADLQNETDEDFPDKTVIKELAEMHYPSLTIVPASFDASKYFSLWAAEQEAPIVIAGSFGRPAISEIFKKSFASGMLKDHWVPLFIAHH